MTRQPRSPRSPRSETRLNRLLVHLREDLQQVHVAPDFGRRVEARIRTEPAMPRPEHRRAIPGWAAVAAGVLLTLGAGLSTRSAPLPYDRGTQLPLALPPLLEEEPEPPPVAPAEEPDETRR